MLDEFLRPQVSERDILMPGRFATLFQDLQRLFGERRRPQRRTGRSADRGSDADDDGLLEQARALLEDDQSSRELLEAYRNAPLGA